MQAWIHNADTGAIEKLEVSNFDFARDCSRALIEVSEHVYRVKIVDPMSGDKLLWDSYSDHLEAAA